MALPRLHVQVVLPALTGMPRDAAINTFTFAAAGDTTPDDMVDAINPLLIAFYNTAEGTDAIADHIARSRDRATDACTMRWYDITAHLNGSPAGPPFREEPWTLGTYATSNSLPEEVAIAISFHGSLSGLSEFAGGVRPRARHRGRVYIGPLVDTVSDTLAPDYVCRPKSNVRQDLELSAEALMDAAVGWSVWSRANAAVYPVVGGWVDDAFDTIRGRGPDPSFRETFGTVV